MTAPSQSFGSISVFFPAFNDERTIGELVNKALEILPSFTDDYEVLVINDGSWDETRMGSGKGSPEHWVAVVKPGRVMFELAGVPEPLAKEALRLAGQKLSVKTKVVKREEELF